MIFLQSLSDIKSASSEVLNRLPSNVNMYLLRTVDATIFRSRKKLGCFAKVGPIAFFTVLEPHRLKNAQETRIRMRGSACSVQNIRNTDISEFIFVTRPREIDEYLTLSDEQKAKIHKTMLKNPERVLNSMTIHAQEETLR